MRKISLLKGEQILDSYHVRNYDLTLTNQRLLLNKKENKLVEQSVFLEEVVGVEYSQKSIILLIIAFIFTVILFLLTLNLKSEIPPKVYEYMLVFTLTLSIVELISIFLRPKTLIVYTRGGLKMKSVLTGFNSSQKKDLFLQAILEKRQERILELGAKL